MNKNKKQIFCYYFEQYIVILKCPPTRKALYVLLYNNIINLTQFHDLDSKCSHLVQAVFLDDLVI